MVTRSPGHLFLPRRAQSTHEGRKGIFLVNLSALLRVLTKDSKYSSSWMLVPYFVSLVVKKSAGQQVSGSATE